MHSFTVSLRQLGPSDLGLTVRFLVGNGGMDPYSSPYIIPNNSPHIPFPHSLLSTRELRVWKFFVLEFKGLALNPKP